MVGMPCGLVCSAPGCVMTLDQAGCINCRFAFNAHIYMICTNYENVKDEEQIKKFGLVRAGIPHSCNFRCKLWSSGVPDGGPVLMEDIMYQRLPGGERPEPMPDMKGARYFDPKKVLKALHEGKEPFSEENELK